MKLSLKEINLAYKSSKNLRKINVSEYDREKVVFKFLFADGGVITAVLCRGNDYLVILPD